MLRMSGRDGFVTAVSLPTDESRRLVRRLVLGATALMLAVAMMLGTQSGAHAYQRWIYQPCGGPFGVCLGQYASACYSGGCFNNYFVGFWKYAESTQDTNGAGNVNGRTGTWAWGVCLDAHGDAPDGNFPWNVLDDRGRADYGNVQYVVQAEWPNPGMQPYPDDAKAPGPNANAPGAYQNSRTHPDDPNYEAAAIQLGVWFFTNQMQWPSACNGCDYQQLVDDYDYVVTRSQMHAGDSRVCYNHQGIITSPSEFDNASTPADGSTFYANTGQWVSLPVWSRVTGDLPQCMGSPGNWGTQVQGAYAFYEAWSGTNVSWNGGGGGGYATAGPGGTDQYGRVVAGLGIQAPAAGQTISVVVRVTMKDVARGEVIFPNGGHRPNGLQPMALVQGGASQVQWQPTHTYYITGTDARPCARVLTEDLTRDGNAGDITQASANASLSGGDKVRHWFDVWNCGTSGNTTGGGMASWLDNSGAVPIDYVGYGTPSNGGRITFPGGHTEARWSVPDLAPGQHFAAYVDSTVVANQPAGVNSPDQRWSDLNFWTNQGGTCNPGCPKGFMNNTWQTVPNDPPPAVASCSATFGSVHVDVVAPFSGPTPTSYNFYDVTSGAPVLVGSSPANPDGAIDIPNHKPGTSYVFTATSVNQNGESPGKATNKAQAFDPAGCYNMDAPKISATERCTAGNAGAHLTWTRPQNTYGEAVNKYTISANRGELVWTITNADQGTWTVTDPGGGTRSVPGSPGSPALDISGLANATQYVFSVSASTQDLTSPVSNPSNAITPSCSG